MMIVYEKPTANIIISSECLKASLRSEQIKNVSVCYLSSTWNLNSSPNQLSKRNKNFTIQTNLQNIIFLCTNNGKLENEN